MGAGTAGLGGGAACTCGADAGAHGFETASHFVCTQLPNFSPLTGWLPGPLTTSCVSAAKDVFVDPSKNTHNKRNFFIFFKPPAVKFRGDNIDLSLSRQAMTQRFFMLSSVHGMEH